MPGGEELLQRVRETFALTAAQAVDFRAASQAFARTVRPRRAARSSGCAAVRWPQRNSPKSCRRGTIGTLHRRAIFRSRKRLQLLGRRRSQQRRARARVVGRRGKIGTGSARRVGDNRRQIALAPHRAGRSRAAAAVGGSLAERQACTRSKPVSARIRRAAPSSRRSPLSVASPSISPPTAPSDSPRPWSGLGTASSSTRLSLSWKAMSKRGRSSVSRTR